MESSTTKAIRWWQPLLTVQMLLMLTIIGGMGFLAGIWFARSTDSPHNNADFQVFWNSWDILESEFYYGLPKDEDLIHAALRGMFARAENPYTFFAPPAVAERDRQRTAGEFGGIGAYVSQNDQGQLVIARPFDNLPAAKAGLQANDIILEINSVSISGWPFEEAVELLRGEIGTDVTLTVYRPATDDQFTVEVTRTRVELPVTDSTLYGSVGYIALSSFNQKATDALEQDWTDLRERGAEALILDLRGNPGGLLNQAVSVSDLFLGAGIVVTQRDRDGNEVVYSADDGDAAEEIPLVVLIDEGSASAAEVVAGAVQDYERAVLIGQQSFGKGSVQHVYDMDDGSQVHVTVAVWLTPNGDLIDGQGLTPDITVTIPEDADPEQDAVLDAALSYFDESAGIAE